ncbi:MAG TPA: c-type cytochrome [Steroidobacteraceae bacterium]|nr:c-type cytochrome [Steroidobacteraceae bacterium]
MKRFLILAAAISGAILSATAVADGNAQLGAAKAVVCRACHGANGNSLNPQWPSLAGIGAGYIAEQLQNFKSGKRQNPIMAANVATLTPQDMANLGAYFDSLPNTGLLADPTYWQAGEKLYRGGDPSSGVPACMGCHGPMAAGNEPGKIPALRGQHATYVITQLQAYASGARTTGPNDIMQTIAKRLTADDMRNVASYLKGIR